jgi:hypothetical protein
VLRAEVDIGCSWVLILVLSVRQQRRSQSESMKWQDEVVLMSHVGTNWTVTNSEEQHPGYLDLGLVSQASDE